ncbi:hypothetical protein BpHYR1_028075 [Brachionus plicatilis]|uniref:Uncharacterized protein n=1 Tax=Brachionus plicatilis TaxID=10195 RepID=A0A3M7R3I7_BRAPC|nr:hypothetical protein BpHYR1_028075 [Brachionus plicatilis]
MDNALRNFFSSLKNIFEKSKKMPNRMVEKVVAQNSLFLLGHWKKKKSGLGLILRLDFNNLVLIFLSLKPDLANLKKIQDLDFFLGPLNNSDVRSNFTISNVTKSSFLTFFILLHNLTENNVIKCKKRNFHSSAVHYLLKKSDRNIAKIQITLRNCHKRLYTIR